MSKPHQELNAAFKAWAMASGDPRSDWVIERGAARNLFEQLEAARASNAAASTLAGEFSVRALKAEEQLETARADRDEWERKAKIDEQQAADRMEDWQIAQEKLEAALGFASGLKEQLHGMESMREAAERERDGLKEQLEVMREALDEIQRIENKLNKDSQNFELECRKAQLEEHA